MYAVYWSVSYSHNNFVVAIFSEVAFSDYHVPQIS